MIHNRQGRPYLKAQNLVIFLPVICPVDTYFTVGCVQTNSTERYSTVPANADLATCLVGENNIGTAEQIRLDVHRTIREVETVRQCHIEFISARAIWRADEENFNLTDHPGQHKGSKPTPSRVSPGRVPCC